MWALSSKTTHSDPGMPSCTTCTKFWSGFIVPARGEEGRHVDLAQPVLDVPVLDDSDDMELTRSVHRVVDFRILRELRERTPHVVRPRLQPAHVPAIEDHHHLLVFGIVGRAGSFVLLESLLHYVGELRSRAVGLRDPARDARR